MPAYRINEAEQDTLETLPALAERLYHRIRRTMHYGTGTCGITALISWDGFAQRLSTPGRPGIAAETVSRDQVRRAAKHLERAGLIQIRSDKKARRLIIDCLKADHDQQQKPPENPPHNPPYTDQAQGQQPRGLQAVKRSEAAPKAARVCEKAATSNEQNPPDNPTDGEYLQAHEIQGFFDQADSIPDREPARPTIEYPPNNRSNTTVPYRTNAGANETGNQAAPTETPNHPMQWAQYFIAQGFKIHRVQTPQTMPMFAEWVRQGITTDDLDNVTLIANTKLGRQPDSPAYYRNFLSQYLIEKQRARAEAATTAALRTTGGHHHENHRPARKLSAVERVAAANGYDLHAGRFLDDAQDW